MDTETAHGDWRNNAACKRADPELFFPIGETSPSDRDQIQRAKSFCVNCLAVNQCLTYALETNQDSGVWGGMTANERRAAKTRQRIQRARAKAAKNDQ